MAYFQPLGGARFRPMRTSVKLTDSAGSGVGHAWRAVYRSDACSLALFALRTAAG
jgi:hypothetical protein